MRLLRGIGDWLGDRIGWSTVREFLAHKTVPVHSATIWYYFGGITLFLFVIQVMTGMLLLLYYRPTSGEAFESVQFIMTQVQFGWLVRSVHSWAANLMVLTAMIHMFSAFFLKAYRRPRELTWLSGMVLLFLALGFGFSGYLLPWNTLSFFATKVGTDMAGVVPVIGGWLLEFLRGGEEVTGATLTRFFGFHVAVLPGLTTLILLFHLAMVQKWGMSSPKEEPHPQTMPFVPNFVLRELIAWYAALGVLGALAALFPWELGTKADAFAPAPAGIHPEWFFLAAFHTLKLIPSQIWVIEGELLGLFAMGAAVLVWVLVPFWIPALEKKTDARSGDRDRRLRRGVSGGIYDLGVSGMTRLLAAALIMSAAAAWGQPAAPTNTCLDCHSLLEGPLAHPAQVFADDIHSQNGFTCANCHGGDPTSEDPEVSMSRCEGFSRQDRPAGNACDVRALPQRCGADASLQAAAAGRSTGAIPHQCSRATAGCRRSERRQLRGLPQRARYSRSSTPAVAGLSAAFAADLRPLPCRRATHAELQHSNRPVREIRTQRSLAGGLGAARSFRADLRHLSRQPWGGAAGRGERGERLRQLPRGVRAAF